MIDLFFANLINFAAIGVGGVLGLLFGTIQNIAFRRNTLRQRSRQLKNGWLIMPGSFGRIAILLMTLAFVQLTCPVFFVGDIRWLVSAGLMLGYGWAMLKKLRQHSTDHA